jgi:hypothetical protein
MRIAHQRAGSGPVLVMPHGCAGPTAARRWMVPDLARDHTSSSCGMRWLSGNATSTTVGGRRSSPTPWRVSSRRSAPRAAAHVGHSSGRWWRLPLLRHHPDVPASWCSSAAMRAGRVCCHRSEVARRLTMFLGMAEVGDAFDPRSYPGSFTDRIPPDHPAVLVAMMRENIRPVGARAAGHIGAETGPRPRLPTVDVPTLVLHGAAGRPFVARQRRGASRQHLDVPAPRGAWARPCVCGGGSREVCRRSSLLGSWRPSAEPGTHGVGGVLMATFVLVHPAWLGGWRWRKSSRCPLLRCSAAPLLRCSGSRHQVHT